MELYENKLKMYNNGETPNDNGECLVIYKGAGWKAKIIARALEGQMVYSGVFVCSLANNPKFWLLQKD